MYGRFSGLETAYGVSTEPLRNRNIGIWVAKKSLNRGGSDRYFFALKRGGSDRYKRQGLLATSIALDEEDKINFSSFIDFISSDAMCGRARVGSFGVL